jgi:hypothetical protein
MLEIENIKYGICFHIDLKDQWNAKPYFIIRETGEMFQTEKEAFCHAKKLFKKLKRK